MPDVRLSLVVTCEHARSTVPAAYARVAQRAGAVLRTHRGYDAGAMDMARFLARRFQAPCLLGAVSRLLVELNRSLHHRELWSEYTQCLSRDEKAAVLRDYYFPYRQSVEDCMGTILNRGGLVFHLSVHSFTPIWRGQARTAEVGLLYDPRQPREVAWACRWKAALQTHAPTLRVRRNYPYLGKADGLVTYLRRRMPAGRYAGLELEVNQSYPLGPPQAWRELKALLAKTLAESLPA